MITAPIANEKRPGVSGPAATHERRSHEEHQQLELGRYGVGGGASVPPLLHQLRWAP